MVNCEENNIIYYLNNCGWCGGLGGSDRSCGISVNHAVRLLWPVKARFIIFISGINQRTLLFDFMWPVQKMAEAHCALFLSKLLEILIEN